MLTPKFFCKSILENEEGYGVNFSSLLMFSCHFVLSVTFLYIYCSISGSFIYVYIFTYRYVL
jgi:hypothetical protein